MKDIMTATIDVEISNQDISRLLERFISDGQDVTIDEIEATLSLAQHHLSEFCRASGINENIISEENSWAPDPLDLSRVVRDRLMLGLDLNHRDVIRPLESIFALMSRFALALNND